MSRRVPKAQVAAARRAANVAKSAAAPNPLHTIIARQKKLAADRKFEEQVRETVREGAERARRR